VLAFLGALIVLAGLAAPASADVFTVRGVEVDVNAANASESRRQAIAAGQLEAAQRLIERLTREADRFNAPPLDAARAARLVAGFNIDEERLIGGTRYVGRLTVEFDPGAVRNLLEAYEVPYVLSTARPAVVVPLWRENGEMRLWQNNPWLEVWAAAGASDELIPVITPSGDFMDLSAVTAEQAARVDLGALERLASNYGAVRALIVLAEPAGAAPQPVEGEAAVPDAETLLVRAQMIGVDFSQGGDVTEYGTVGTGPAVEIARQSASMLQEDWKAQVFVSEPYLSDLEVSVLFNSLAEWSRLQYIIGGEPLVQDAQLEALTNDGASMHIEHRGRIEQLELVLREQGAELFETRQGWIISANNGGAAAADAGGLTPP
jgi:hypothetical protein